MTTATVTCEERIGWTPTSHGFAPRICRASRYLRRWTDTTDTEHVSCPKHLAAMTHRWPVGDVAPQKPEAVPGPCIWQPCVATWRHWHGPFPGGYDDPADPQGAPIDFEGDEPDEGVRDYNGAPLRPEAVPGVYVSREEADALWPPRQTVIADGTRGMERGR